MFISNLNISSDRYYVCGIIVGKYLMNCKIPLLSRKKNLMVFAKTKKLQEAINKMPFYIKIFCKRGCN